APGGVGIGLTLVRSLVQMHGGTVAAESAGPGSGSVFTIRLPAGAAAPPMTATDPATGAHARAVAVPEILVVDDNADAAESLAALLEMLGAHARVTHDGIAAIAACRERLPHVAFLDIGMPSMDGYEVARRIRELPGGADVEVIALTGWGQDKDRRRSAEAGFDRHLVKPVELQMLRAILRTAGNRPTRNADATTAVVTLPG